MREIKHLSVHQWLRSAIPDSQQPTSPIGFLFLKLPPPPCAVLLVIWIIIPKRVEKHLWNYQVRIVWWKVDSINVRYTPYTATLCYPEVAYTAYSGNPPRRSLFAAVPRRRRLRTASSFARLQRSDAPPQATRSRRNAARASGERRRNAPAAKGLNRKDIKIRCGNWNKLNHSTIWRMTISWWKKMMMQGGLWRGAGSVKTVANLHFKPFASLCRKWLIVLAVLVKKTHLLIFAYFCQLRKLVSIPRNWRNILEHYSSAVTTGAANHRAPPSPRLVWMISWNFSLTSVAESG